MHVCLSAISRLTLVLSTPVLVGFFLFSCLFYNYVLPIFWWYYFKYGNLTWETLTFWNLVHHFLLLCHYCCFVFLVCMVICVMIYLSMQCFRKKEYKLFLYHCLYAYLLKQYQDLDHILTSVWKLYFITKITHFYIERCLYLINIGLQNYII